MTTKICTHCRLPKPLTDFSRRHDQTTAWVFDETRPGHRRSACRACEVARVREIKRARPHRVRADRMTIPAGESQFRSPADRDLYAHALRALAGIAHQYTRP